MRRIVGFIQSLADEARERPVAGGGFDPPHATFNVGTIEGGTALNIIPRRCVFSWDYRPLPDDDTAAVIARYDRFIADDVLPPLRAEFADGSVDTEVLAEVRPLRPDPDGPAETLARRLTGANAAGTVAFVTEAGIFQAAGISAVVCGPGDIAQAHQPNEFITREQMAAGEAFLRRLADWAAA